MRLIDVSHTLESGMLTYNSLPAPVVCDYFSRAASRGIYAPGTEFQIGRIDIVANTGTYLDSPFHRYVDGKDLSRLPLRSLVNLPCLVARIEPSTSRAIESLPFATTDVRGKAAPIRTDWVHFLYTPLQRLRIEVSARGHRIRRRSTGGCRWSDRWRSQGESSRRVRTPWPNGKEH
jgi:kynurenine formamidase